MTLNFVPQCSTCHICYITFASCRWIPSNLFPAVRRPTYPNTHPMYENLSIPDILLVLFLFVPQWFKQLKSRAAAKQGRIVQVTLASDMAGNGPASAQEAPVELLVRLWVTSAFSKVTHWWCLRHSWVLPLCNLCVFLPVVIYSGGVFGLHRHPARREILVQRGAGDRRGARSLR